MKTSTRFLLLSTLIVCLLFSNVLNAQTDKNDLKLQKLKENVARYEAKVAAKERKMEIADSLVTTGEYMMYDAEDVFEDVEEEQSTLDKEYKTKYKELAKLQKSKDTETVNKAAADLKALEIQYKADTKVLDTRIKELTKKAMKGQSNMDKGKDMQKTTSQYLKEAKERLEAAKEKYEAAL